MVLDVTKKGKAPIKLYYSSAEEMYSLSNKRDALQEIFKLMDVDKKGRIDTMELLAVIFIGLQGKYEIKLSNSMFAFGFSNPSEFTKDEAHFYFDSLFRGLMKVCIPRGHSKPILAGKRVASSDIDGIVD